MGRRGLYRLSVALADLVIEQHRARLRGRVPRITVDLDPTDDPTHGQQEFTFFNGHYDTWCYLPLVATLTFDAEPTQYLVATVLRLGNSPATDGPIGLVRRLVRRLGAAFPQALLRVRLDGGFARPAVLHFLYAGADEYVVTMASTNNNPRFVITNLADPSAAVSQVYRERGDMESRLEELHRAGDGSDQLPSVPRTCS